VVGHLPGDLSEAARTFLYVPYLLVFFCGYSLWVMRLNALVFHGIGWNLLKVFFQWILLKRKPRSVEEVLPSKEQWLEMLVRAQKAGASFGPVGWPIGITAGLMALLFSSAMGPLSRFALVAGSCIAWGHLLGCLGRRGWLPFMQEN
jgi:hypothetical protein